MLDTGNVFVTPVISNTTTYYAENIAEGSPIIGGESYNVANGDIYTAAAERLLIFDVYTDIVLKSCLLYTSPSPRDRTRSRMPSSA